MKKMWCLLLIGLIVSLFATAFSEAKSTYLENPNVKNGPEQGKVIWSFEVINPGRTAEPDEWVQWRYKVTNSKDSTGKLTLGSLISSIPDGLAPRNPYSWDDAEFPPSPLNPGESFEGNHIAWHVDPAAPPGMIIEGELGASALFPANPQELWAPVKIEVVEGPVPPGSMEGTVWNALVLVFDSETGQLVNLFRDVFRFSEGIFTADGFGSAPYTESIGDTTTTWESTIVIDPDWWALSGAWRWASGSEMMRGEVDSNVGLYFKFIAKQTSSASKSSAKPTDWDSK